MGLDGAVDADHLPPQLKHCLSDRQLKVRGHKTSARLVLLANQPFDIQCHGQRREHAWNSIQGHREIFDEHCSFLSEPFNSVVGTPHHPITYFSRVFSYFCEEKILGC